MKKIDSKYLVFRSNAKVLIEILGISIEILGFSFEILGILKICENRIPYTSKATRFFQTYLFTQVLVKAI